MTAHKVGYAGLAAGLYQFLKHGFKRERVFGLFGFAIGILAKYYALSVVKLAGVPKLGKHTVYAVRLLVNILKEY